MIKEIASLSVMVAMTFLALASALCGGMFDKYFEGEDKDLA
jgi:hypothetical protein